MISANERERYQRYLCSREWAVLKEAVKTRSAGVCERCRYAPMDHVHHLTYARKYNESLDDLQAICLGCHEFTHGKRDRDPILDLPKALIQCLIFHELSEDSLQHKKAFLALQSAVADLLYDPVVMFFRRDRDNVHEIVEKASRLGWAKVVFILSNLPYSWFKLLEAVEGIACEIGCVYVGSEDNLSAINFAKRLADKVDREQYLQEFK